MLGLLKRISRSMPWVLMQTSAMPMLKPPHMKAQARKSSSRAAQEAVMLRSRVMVKMMAKERLPKWRTRVALTSRDASAARPK